MSLLEVKGLKVHFSTKEGLGRAVDGVDFNIEPGQTLGVVGESGCGKSVTALSIMGLVQCPPGRIAGGEILFDRRGQVADLARLDPKGAEIRSIRGKDIAMIFQEPMTSLNPVHTIGRQIMEPIRLHQKLSKKEAREMAVQMLRSVGIPAPERRIGEYPHEMSGGMRQRVMIAIALSCHPGLLIADEPTTALDVTIQAQVLDLMKGLQKEFGAAIMFITHDLGTVAEIADQVVVMYRGRVVENAPARTIFDCPAHPYTQGLMDSIPALDSPRDKPLVPIRGVVPSLNDAIPGCGFEPRCPRAGEICREQQPPLKKTPTGSLSACWF